MSKSAYRSPSPSQPPSYDAGVDDERTAVRKRPGCMPGAHASGEQHVVHPVADEHDDRPTLPSPTRELVERSERLERKLRFARVLLQLLPSNDSRARILRAAMIRRDEVLLDGILRVLEAVNDLPGLDAKPAIAEAPAAPDQTTAPASDRPRTLLPPALPPDTKPEPE